MERRSAARLGISVLAAVLVAACSAAPPPGSPTPAPPTIDPGGEVALAAADRLAVTPQDAEAAAAAVNAFGLDLYREVATGTENVVVSPASVALALAMARAGARGETAEQMDAVLRRFGSDAVAAWPAALDEALAGRSGTYPDPGGTPREILLRIANAPFGQRGMPLEPAFLEALAGRFGAGLRLVDYIGATEDARVSINAWVDEQTQERIPELLAPGTITPETRLTLVNAIYLKAPWETPFSVEATSAAPFTRPDGSVVEVPTMAAGGSLRHAAGDDWTAVEIPYLGGQLAMTVIVPDDLAAFEASLSDDGFAAVVAALAERPVELFLPRFGIETKASLADALAALGMPAAFDPDLADFSGITAAEALVIDDVIHQANIDVDEKGTEAAAATAVVMRAGSAAPDQPVTVRVDRPFLFALRDVPTGAVLFLGRVTDPSVGR